MHASIIYLRYADQNTTIRAYFKRGARFVDDDHMQWLVEDALFAKIIDLFARHV